MNPRQKKLLFIILLFSIPLFLTFLHFRRDNSARTEGPHPHTSPKPLSTGPKPAQPHPKPTQPHPIRLSEVGKKVTYTERNRMCEDMIAKHQPISDNPPDATEVLVIRTTFSAAHQADHDYWLNMCNFVIESHEVGRAVKIFVDETKSHVDIPTSPLDFSHLVVVSKDNEVKKEMPGYQGQWMDGCLSIALWATKQHYAYIWWAEDDTRYIGHLGAYFDSLPRPDFTSFEPILTWTFNDPGWIWSKREKIHGPWLNDIESGKMAIRGSFIPIGGMSPRLARAVVASSAQGNQANQEMHIPTVAFNKGFSLEGRQMPGRIALGCTPYCPFLKGEERPIGEMFHPMKPTDCQPREE
eukprot:gnl/Trimastix_PCT/4109.p1 GENE.gnl/Trimastix_PCT/4109~~gnl/Trimastix_PCT/4109.p1  ORF type:complete len:354 (+),score=48.15 gnl/Trimastix_PCT/4109:90-1151(+)